MGDACPFPLDSAYAATAHWLGLAAIMLFVGVLALVTAWLCARTKIEELEGEVDALVLSLADAESDHSDGWPNGGPWWHS